MWTDPLGWLHGNAKASPRPTHVYVILDARGKLVKCGISSGKIRQDGKSYRAESQVRKFNAGYSSKIIAKCPNRQKALDREQDCVDKYSLSQQRKNDLMHGYQWGDKKYQPFENQLPRART